MSSARAPLALTVLVAQALVACSSGGSSVLGAVDASTGKSQGTQPDQAEGPGPSTRVDGGTTPGPSSCRAGGESCANGTDCCSNRCVDGACDPCAVAGDDCGAGASCCSNATPRLSCFQGKCSTCLGAGATCKTTSDCCSRACTGGTCEAPSTTKPDASLPPTCDVSTELASQFPTLPSLCKPPLEGACCAQTAACLADGGCTALVECRIACASDFSCLSTCQSSASAAAKSHFSSLAQCLSNQGAGACIP